jgi:hypothetical protein
MFRLRVTRFAIAPSRHARVRRTCGRALGFLAGSLLLLPAAQAQPAPAPEPPAPVPAPQAAPAPPEPSGEPAAGREDAELDEIEAALAADQAAAKPATGGAAPPTSARGTRPAAAGSMNPDLTFIADFAGAAFSDEDHLQTGAHDPVQTGFNLQQLELSVGSSVDPYFRFDANLVFALAGVEIEEAYGTTLSLPYRLQARVGQFLSRFGRINSQHPHSWNFVDQPFALGRLFGGEGNRGLGVEVSWLTPLPWYVELALSSMQANGEATMRSFFGAEDFEVEGPRDLLHVAAIEQFFPLSQDWSLSWGLSGALGPNASGRANRTDVYGTDVYLKYRPITEASFTVVSLQTEWFYRRRQLPDELLQDVNGYVEGFWRFAQRWGTAARYEYGSPALDGSGDATTDPLDPEWSEARHRLSANVTLWPTEFSRLRLQGSRDMPGYRSSIWAAFLAVELVTGAHGAHVF